MLGTWANAVGDLLGSGAGNLSLWQALLRTVVVHGAALAFVRVGEKRFLGKSTASDVVVAVMLGSVVSRGINGSAPLVPSLGAGAMLVALHWLTVAIAFRSDRLGDLVKGTTRVLVRDGEVQWEAMRKSHVTKQDLLGGLRTAANVDEPESMERAYLERSGEISAVKRESRPRVVEIAVEEGVQTVRLRVE